MTKKAKLPGLPAPNFQDSALQRWAEAVTERLEVREGSRGDPLEQVVTKRDLKKPTLTPLGFPTTVPSPDTLDGFAEIPVGNGLTASIDINAFAEKLRNTRLFRELSGGIGTGRADTLSTEVKELLTRRLVSETMARGAQIARTELKISEVSRAIAAVSTELTAALDSTSAGIRSTQFAIATETSAIAGQVTQLEARLQVEVATEDLLPVPPAAAYANFAALELAVPANTADTRKYYRVAGSPEQLYRSDGSTWNLVGSQQSARLEEVLLVTADKSLGLEAQYTLKVNAGRAIAGFGIAATERDGVPDSAFIIQANQFSLITPPDFAQSTTPTATAIGQTWYKTDTETYYRATATGAGGWVVFNPVPPFGVDATTGTAYVSNSLRVGGGTGLQMLDVQTGVTNFNSRNDRNGTAIVTPTIASDGTAVDHTANTDGSVDISFEWAWTGNNADIDGWIVKVYTNTDGAAYTFGTTPAAEAEFFLPPDKRALIGYGYPANVYYKFGVQAYRVVDPDVNAAGIIKSTLVVPSLGAENPYRPSANVAFAGNVTGTINGTAAATVTSNAADGATAYSAVFNVTTGLSSKMGNAQKNILSGEGGLKLGATIDWASDGSSVTGVGVAITSKGIVGRNSSGPTFTIDATTGNATFSGDISGASGTFTGSVITGGQVKATGSTNDITFGNYSILANPSNSSVNGILGQSINGTGVRGYSENNSAGLFTGGGGQPTVYIESGSSVAGLRVQGQVGGVAISVTQGYITRPFSTTGRLTVYEQTPPYNAVGTYLYEFHV